VKMFLREVGEEVVFERVKQVKKGRRALMQASTLRRSTAGGSTQDVGEKSVFDCTGGGLLIDASSGPGKGFFIQVC